MSSWYQSVASRGHPSAAHVWQPRNTSSVIFSKGLLNAPGENNCFLNSAVQVLWHLDVFRRSFREMGGHACMGSACIFCALKVLFTQLRYSEQQSLPPDALRKALAVAFQDEHRFQLGCMDDAAECFENILTRIHFHLAHDIKEELCDAKHCISHRKFAMTLIEHSVCPCGATSEPFPFTQMVHYVSCTALCAEAKKLKEKYRWSNSVCFGQVLRNAGAIGDIRDCPSECGKKINIRRVLMNCPDVVAIGLVWDSDRPEKEHIVDVIQCLGTSLRMPDLFNSVVDEKAKQAALHLVGVVTYYGKHYSTFFYNTALRVWVYFDDATVKQVGPNWRDVVNRCKRGHSQPLLLLFANPNGSPVPTDTAPEESTLLPGYTQTKNPTAINPSRTCGMLDNSCSSASSIKCRSLQPVWEYEPDYESQKKTFPEQKDHKKNEEKYVVEIGHDALRTMNTRYNSGHNTSQKSRSLIQGDPGIFDNNRQPRKTSITACQEYSNKNPAEDMHGIPPLPVNLLAKTNAAQCTDASSHPNSSGTTPCRAKENKRSDQIQSLSEDTKKTPLHSHSNDEMYGNMPLLKSRGLPISDLHEDASHLVGSHVTGINYSVDRHHLNTNCGQMSHPKRLERHESWSGRPSQPLACAPKTFQSRQHNDKYSAQRDNSFSHRSMPNSQPHTVYSSVPNLQDIPLSLGCKVPHHGMHKSQTILQYSSNQQSMPNFGSVPNLHGGFDKSISVQNITMAEEGILANAIKNNIQQKRVSTSDVSTYMGSNNGSCNSQSVTSGVMSGQESVLGSTSHQHSYSVTGIITQSTKKNIDNIQPSRRKHLDRCNQKATEMASWDKFELEPEGMETLTKSNDERNQTHHLNLMHDTNIDHSSFNPKRTTRETSPRVHNSSPFTGCYGLHDRDSVASRDSGYRSRDRSSASSGSVYSVEASANGGPRNVGTEFNQQKTSFEKEAEKSDKPAACINRACDMEVVCYKVCAECADLEAHSRRMGDAGDLATALALCTASVTKLKECLKQDGICSQTRQLLHCKYNNAVLQSRNLHRRLTLLRRQDSFPLGHDQLSHDIQPYIGPSQPTQPAKELYLINLQEHTVEPSRVDRLKQQLHELYMQKPSTTVTSNIQHAQLEASCLPTLLPCQAMARTYSAKTHVHVPVNRQEAFNQSTLSQDVYNRMSDSNRNPSACNESCMVNGLYQDSRIHLSHWKAEEEPVRKYVCQTVVRNEDECSDSIQHDIPIDPIRNSVTETKTQKYGTMRNHNQHFKARIFNEH